VAPNVWMFTMLLYVPHLHRKVYKLSDLFPANLSYLEERQLQRKSGRHDSALRCEIFEHHKFKSNPNFRPLFLVIFCLIQENGLSHCWKRGYKVDIMQKFESEVKS
jgi:hypothetical protein